MKTMAKKPWFTSKQVILNLIFLAWAGREMALNNSISPLTLVLCALINLLARFLITKKLTFNSNN